MPFQQALLQVNSAQTPPSLLYVLSNAILTDVVSNQEWTSFSMSYRLLRVRKPVNLQRSTYYLGLLFHYSVPLMLSSSFLHWLGSQSSFRPVHLPLLR